MDWIAQEQQRDYHHVAALFPLMEGQEYEQLKADIAAHGLLEAIWLHPDGSIIDGRNRHRACLETGTRPRVRTWNGEGPLVSFVVSQNLHRRHLTSSQQAVIALEVLPLLEEEARERKLATLRQNTDSQRIDYREEQQGKATSQAAQLLHTNRQYVSDAKKLQREAPDLLEQVREGEMTIPKAKGALRKRQAQSALYSSKSSEWHTPECIIERVVRVMGEIDLDPCSNEGEPNVPAGQHFTKATDGLSRPWTGRVYMNPPYGQGIILWVEHLCQQFERGDVSEAIALVPARTDPAWFRRLREYARCFVWGRLKFSGNGTGAPFPSMAVYLGPNVGRFAEVFADIGDVYVWMGRGDGV